MKNNILKILTLVSLVFVFSACEDQGETIFTAGANGTFGANLITPSTGAYLRGETETIDMELELVTNEGIDVSGIKVYGQLELLSGTGSDVVELATVSSGGVVSFTPAELFNSLTVGGAKLSEDELAPGDTFTFNYELTMADGRVLTIASKYVVTFTCPSNLGGMYINTTEVSVSDFGPQSYEYEVELVDLGDGRYEIEDMTGGLWSLDPYAGTYGTSARATVLTEVCGNVTVADAPDQFGGFITTEGRPAATYDSETGVITWSWIDTIYGETGVTTYTPVQ